ncbi:ATP-grasp domain-containing protein [Alkalicoccus luteus]|uniref:ATP-grasp domain-containing protein n=1 Tax=Alkalicoccus luteus TaxID=1237094 RepID=UPI004033A0B0
MINIIVTGIGGPTAQGVMQGLRKRQDVRIIGLDRREVNSGLPFCDTFQQIPSVYDRSSYETRIIELVEEYNAALLFPCLHEEITIYAELRHQLSCIVATPTSDVIHSLINKTAVYQLLEKSEAAVYVPRYAPFSSSNELNTILTDQFSNDEVVVSKAAASHGAVGFALLTSKKRYLEEISNGNKQFVAMEDFTRIDHNGGELVMEYLPGIEFSVDIYLFHHEVIAAVSRERTGVSSGIVLDGKVVFHPKLIEAASITAKSLITTGFMNLQFIEKDGEFKLTDVNPRFCGSQVMSLGAGVNFPELVLQYEVLHERPVVSPQWNTRMIRFRDQFFLKDEETST